MLQKFVITYIPLSGIKRTTVIEATSKYDAKQRFYRKHPKYKILHTEVVKNESNNPKG